MRLLLFFIGFPLLIALIFFLPQFRHLALNILIITVSVLGTRETARFFQKQGRTISIPIASLSGLLLPLVSYLETIGLFPAWSLDFTLISAFAVTFAVPAFRAKKDTFHEVLPDLSAWIVTLVYPGFFLSFAVKISSFDGASVLFTLLVMGVYLNDAAAWLIGNLFGKSSRNIIAVSPNKSLIGFVAGFFTSLAVFIAAFFLFPSLFAGSLLSAGILGSFIGISGIIGDLMESAMKRSAEMKDSGSIIPGRGGVLDSVDSVIFSAPFFYYFYYLLFSGS